MGNVPNYLKSDIIKLKGKDETKVTFESFLGNNDIMTVSYRDDIYVINFKIFNTEITYKNAEDYDKKMSDIYKRHFEVLEASNDLILSMQNKR